MGAGTSFLVEVSGLVQDGVDGVHGGGVLRTIRIIMIIIGHLLQ